MEWSSVGQTRNITVEVRCRFVCPVPVINKSGIRGAIQPEWSKVCEVGIEAVHTQQTIGLNIAWKLSEAQAWHEEQKGE